MREEPAADIFARIAKNAGLFEKAVAEGDRKNAMVIARDSAACYRRLAKSVPLRELEYASRAKEWDRTIAGLDDPVSAEPDSGKAASREKTGSPEKRTHTVFISYASPDLTIARSVCTYLESNNVPCWISPRDILPGKHYPQSIIRAIDECGVVVLICSKHSNKSLHVLRELEEAVMKEIAILPFRIDNEPLSEDMRYLINIHHWLDAFDRPAETYLDSVLGSVNNLLAMREKTRGGPV